MPEGIRGSHVAFSERSAARKRPPPVPQGSGVLFAFDHSGHRSSARAGKHVIAAALQPLNAAAGAAAFGESQWRQNYVSHFRALVRAQAAAPAQVLSSCAAGMQALATNLSFVAAGQEQPVAAAIAAALRQAPSYRSVTLRGEGDSAPAPWRVPYRGRVLQGDALARQIDRWEAQGVAEPSHAQALRLALAHPQWFDLRDRHIVLLGAGSEAGPIGWLARWRANVVAVDLPRPALWTRLARLVREGNGTLIAPLPPGAPERIDAAGADLLTAAPDIAAWLAGLAAHGSALDIGNLAYLDGERHVRLAVAMDAISQALCEADPRTTLAYMATPTDVFAVPEAVAAAVMKRYAARNPIKRLLQAGLRAGSGGRGFVPHIDELLDAGSAGRWGVVDAVVIEQGPNYLLAKRLQQWRALLARAAGHRVSFNVAPSTTTASVLSNKLLAAGFRGAKAFDCEVFEPATTNALMAALWVHDLRNERCAADPAAPLSHPLQFLVDGANHGGLWRVPYLPRSVLPMAALLGMVQRG